MNSRQLQYAIALSQDRSFSQVAEKLGISQPALSKQILALEKELGVRLFDRDSTPVTVTPAGERFIQEAKDLIYKEDQLLRTMERFRSGKEGRLTIGITPFRSLYLIPGITKRVAEKFPGIRICLQEYGSEVLRKETAEGKYDFAIVNLPVDESLLDMIPLEPDKLMLAVPNELLGKLPAIPGKQLDMADCAQLPFVVVGKNQEMRQLFERLCARSQVHPPIAMEVIGVATAWSMAQAGLGAALVPLQFVGSETFGQNVTLFTIKDNTFTRQPAIVTRRGQELSDAARYAIDLLTGKE